MRAAITRILQKYEYRGHSPKVKYIDTAKGFFQNGDFEGNVEFDENSPVLLTGQ